MIGFLILWEYYFYLLQSLPYVITLPHFQIIYYVSLYYEFILYSGDETWIQAYTKFSLRFS